MAKIGYARISTIDQNPDLQIDALRAAGCCEIFKDEVSAVGTDRPQFEHALSILSHGDSLVIWKLDRAFRSTIDALTTWDDLKAKGVQLMIATLGIVSDTPEGRYFYRGVASAAEFERDMISARTKEGMAAAKKRGRHVGRPAAMSRDDLVSVGRKIDQGANLSEIASQNKVSERILVRRLRAYGLLNEAPLEA